MALDTSARAGLDAIIAAEPWAEVEVKYRSQESTGLCVLRNKETEPGLMGQAGTTISTIRVRSDEIDEPERGAHITVDDVQVYVLACRTSGGVRVIECSDTQPIEGV